MIGRRLWGVVLRREGARTSRRWQIYAVRVVAALVLGVIMATVLALNGTNNPEQFAKVGKYLFNAYSVCMLLGAGGVAPVAMAQAMLEERESGTLETLILTNVRPLDLLTGKLGTSVGHLLLLGLGTLPIGLLSITLGGVAPAQALSLAVATVSLALCAGLIAAVVALASRSLAIPVLTTFVWAAFVPIFMPMMTVKPLRRLAGMHLDQFQTTARQSGLFGAFSDEPWAVFGSTPMVVTALLCLIVAATIFRRGVLNGFQRPRFPLLLRYLWPLWLTGLLAYWGVMSQVSSAYAPPWWLAANSNTFTWVLVGFTWLAQVLVTLLLVQGAVWLVPRLTGKRSALRVRPWPGAPILQRELLSRAHGPLGRFLLVLVGVWLVASCGGVVSTRETDLLIGGAFIGIMGTVLTTTLITTSSIAGERQRGTLELLCLTTLPKHRLLLEKVAGTMTRGALPAILTLLMIIVATEGEFLGDGQRLYGDVGDRNLWPGAPLLRAFASIVWFCCAWMSLTLGQFALATRIKNANVVWAVNTVLGLVAPVMIFATGLTLSESRHAPEWVQFIGELLFPFAKAWRYGGLPLALLIATAAWAIIAALMWALAVWTLHRHGHKS